MSKPIDRVKLQQDIVGAVSNAAQRFLEAASDAQRQKAAGAINGLADMLDDVFSIAGDGELRAAFQGDMLQGQRLADDADTAASVRYHTAAANEISAVIRIMDAWTEVKEAKAEYDAAIKKHEAPAPVIANEVVGHEDEPVDPGQCANYEWVDDPPAPKPEDERKKYYRRGPRVNTDDILVWLLCRNEGGQETVPIDDIAIEFYLRGGRGDLFAHKAALNAMYSLEKRNCVETHRREGGKYGRKTIVSDVSLTTHGVFEAQRIRGPIASNTESKSEDDLLKEFGHLKEEVGDA